MGKMKTQTPLQLEREKGLRLSEMLTTVVDTVQQLQEQKEHLGAKVNELIGSADVSALEHVGRLSEQVEHMAVEIARKGTTRAGIEQSLVASASAVAVLEREHDKEILEMQGRELSEVRVSLFERFKVFINEVAAEVQATEEPHRLHQELREKTFGSPEGKAQRELDRLRGLVRVLTDVMREAL